MPHVYIHPQADEGPDPGRGGIYRVILDQYRGLPRHGWEITQDPSNADVIACHVEVPETFLRLYPTTPVVVHNHGLYWTDYEWGEQWCYQVNAAALDSIRLADSVTAVSEWTAQAIRRATSREVHVVYHSVDTEEWTPDPKHDSYVLWNKTRIDPVCDPGPIEELAREMPEQRFVSTFARERRANMMLTGLLPYEEAKQHVRRAGVYLCTTRETFGIGTLEALAAGVPVVGYRHGGQREIIEHERDGWLVTPGDIGGLIEGIQWALAHRDEIGERAREKAKQFPVERAAERYAEIYNEVYAKHREPHFPTFVGAEVQEPERPAPKVSVVVTSYNLSEFLPAALASVQAQSMDDWECIIVDDASTDGSLEIAEQWSRDDPRFQVVRHETNQYLAAARNTGIEHSQGRYVIPLDADDRLAPRALQVLSEALDVDRRTWVAYGNVRFFEEDQKTPVVYEGAQRRGLAAGYSGWPFQFRLDLMLRGPGQLTPYCAMFRREAWELTGGYRTRCGSSEDQDFWLRTSSYGFEHRMVTEADTLLYTVREGSMSGSEGWRDHRPWFPWAGEFGDLDLIPGGAVQVGKAVDQLPMRAHDPVLISVVIPVGPGHGKYVHDSVDSVDAQTFRDWECIVINDSGEPLPNLPTWVRVLCSDPTCPDQDGDPCHSEGFDPAPWPKGNGPARARNKGIAASKAPVFLPLDADDYLEPNALQLMIDAMVANNRAIVYPDFWEDVHGHWTIWENPDYEPEKLLTEGVLHSVTALTPKSVWEDVGGYPEDLPWEDWAFQIACAAKGHCSVRIAAPLFSYRKHTGLRRNDNFAHFEESKLAIMTHDFGVPRGGKLMACGSCGSGRATTVAAGNYPRSGNSIPPPPDEDAILVEYLGPRAGNFRIRSRVANALYTFSSKRPTCWVHKGDAEALIARGDFQIRHVEEETEQAPTEPTLVAERTPAMEGAITGPAGAGTNTSADVQPPETELPVWHPSQAEAAPPVDGEEPPEPASEDDLVKNHSRPELNQMAEQLGIEGAAALKNKAEVAAAIRSMQRMRTAFSGGPDRPSQPAIPA